jgi:asparagine synthase (glutamine-hydrolysing)
MCGIAGIVKLNNTKVDYNQLRIFTDSIAHRGPDGFGYELLDEERIGFGHRRLSILDLSEAGKQPMYSNDNNLCITYNGEIYNFIEIRDELSHLGYQFKTQTDTEVILAAFKKWGEACLDKFNGMFAIAIYDAQNKSLFIARDRFGVKPFYYLYIPDQLFAFASETIAFKNLEGYRRELNEDVFKIALHQPEIIEGTSFTIYKNIYQLRPGHFLKIKNRSLEIKRWWMTQTNNLNIPASFKEQTEHFKQLFIDSCKLRLRSDVPIATALSGGLDSSSVYATLLNILNSTTIERTNSNNQKAFVAVFPNSKVDERKYAESLIQQLNGNAVYIEPNYSNLTQEIIRSTKLFDGLIGTPISAISAIYKAMKDNGITVSLDGHGVDEMLYGYNSYINMNFHHYIANGNKKQALSHAKILGGLNSPNNQSYFDKLVNNSMQSNLKTFVKKYVRPYKRTPISYFQGSNNFVDKVNEQVLSEILNELNICSHELPGEEYLYSDFHSITLPINLRDFDRASMQSGIEIRMPFMDYRLVNFVFNLPVEAKYGNGFTKLILREAMKGILPEDIRTRTHKIGIAAPLLEWFNKEIKEFVLDEVHSNTFINSQLWNGKNAAENLNKELKNGELTMSKCSKYWSLINANLILKN